MLELHGDGLNFVVLNSQGAVGAVIVVGVRPACAQTVRPLLNDALGCVKLLVYFFMK
ncbi:hypothetical protein [Phytopseudomonas argentinensis]|uniref:hypothetical protein n=1 Tax=Phytopseudomonas argentinensis TaxID=289370 RepID=UPI00147864C5|nr:hypothetical protein [Pseudomonas argentinensis]